MALQTNKMLAVFLLALVNFTHILDFMIMMPMSDMLTKKLSISSQTFSVLVSSYGIAAFFAGVIGVSIFNRFDRKKLLLVTYALFLGATLSCSLVSSYEALLVMRCGAGFFGGVIGAIVVSITADMFEVHERGRAMGMLMMGFAAASIFGVPMGLWLADGGHWQYPFIMIAGFGILLWFLLLLVLPPVNKHLVAGIPQASFFQIIQRSFSSINQRNALLLSFVLTLGHFMIIPFIAMYMIRNVGIAESHIMYIYLIGGTVSVLASAFIGKITDQYGAKKVFAVFVLLATIPVIIITNLPPVSYAVAFSCTALFFLLAGGRMIPATTLISTVVTPQERGSFESLRSSIMQLAAAASALIGGLIVNDKGPTIQHYEWAGYASVLLCLSCLIFSSKIPVVKRNNG